MLLIYKTIIHKSGKKRRHRMEIMGNLWQVGGAEYTSVEDAAIYLIRFGEKAALIDAGCGGDHDSLVKNISDILPPDVKIEYLLLTHCHYDHTGGAEGIRHQYGCKRIFYARVILAFIRGKRR